MKLNNSQGQGFYSQKQSITIYFRTLMGKGDKLTLQLNSTIRELIELISKILKEQTTNIELFSLGRNLNKKQSTLLQYGIKDGSIVHVQCFHQNHKKVRDSLPQQHQSNLDIFQRYSQNAREVAIFLKIKAQNFQIPISNQQTVRSLKQQIEKRSNFKADYLCLSHLGKEMIDQNTLQQSGIYSSAWISGQYLQPPPKHQNKFTSLFNGNTVQSSNTITTEMFENVEQLKLDDRQQQQQQQDNQQYHFMKNDHPLQTSEDINNMITNIKLSESVQILSPNANIQIPYQYNFDDFTNSKFLKKSGFIAQQSEEKEQDQMINSSPIFLQVNDKTTKQVVQKFEGQCQIKLRDLDDTINYTIDCLKSSYRTDQLKEFIVKLQKSRNKSKKIILLNPNNKKPLAKDTQICQLPWQSIILNRVLYANLIFTTEQQQNNSSE